MKKKIIYTLLVAALAAVITTLFFCMAARDKAAMEDYDRFLASPYYKECRGPQQTCYKAYKKGGDKTQ